MSKIITAYHVLYCSYTKVNTTSVSVNRSVAFCIFLFAKTVVFGFHIIYFVYSNSCNYDEF